ncbi:6260_t:CDS:2 [Paraglomus brasilianum]|uniref:6260_t:CDS:1 n=1 Tax=Paraglomus brasilianum TaxID=144538 RepID=A0A9N8W417_9GLOM|nr:6260_t:CDS:2 [Paraglomus brasilianum]
MSKRKLSRKYIADSDVDEEEQQQADEVDPEESSLLSEKKRVTVRKWNAIKMVDIREFYDGSKPTKKGISLTIDQWKKLKSFIDNIDGELKKL